MKIACVLMVHFPVKAELRRHPELKGKPIIITEEYGSEQTVLDSSLEAKGVIAGMPLQEALAYCKPAQLLQADRPSYEAVFDEVVYSLQQRSPLVEKNGLGCAYVGLDGLEAMYGGEARLITSLLRAVPDDLDPRMGVAEGKFPSYAAAMTAGDGQATRVPEDIAEFLKGMSINLLPLSWESKTRLRLFGLRTLGQLASLPVGPIQAQFGWDGQRAWELANGIDHSPLVPHQRQLEISEYLVFPYPAVTQQAILTAVETLLGRTFARKEVKGKYVRIMLAGHTVKNALWTKRFVLKEAIRSKDKVFNVVKNGLEGITLPGPLEDIALSLTGFTGESGIQGSLFLDVRKREQLREMMQQLEVQLGCQPPIYQVRDIEPWSRNPERRQALVIFDP
jgi:nucleotidyltransferase/DNA polymerase involved in DNA repair